MSLTEPLNPNCKCSGGVVGEEEEEGEDDQLIIWGGDRDEDDVDDNDDDDESAAVVPPRGTSSAEEEKEGIHVADDHKATTTTTSDQSSDADDDVQLDDVGGGETSSKQSVAAWPNDEKWLKFIEHLMLTMAALYTLQFIAIDSLIVLFAKYIDDYKLWSIVLRICWVTGGWLAMLAFFLVGGRDNIDLRVLGRLYKSWPIYVVLGMEGLNLAIDFVAPFSKTTKVDTSYFLIYVLWFCASDAVVLISDRFRRITCVLFAGAVAWNFISNFIQQDQTVWGLSKKNLKTVIFSQMGMVSWRAVKRAAWDSKRRFLHIPTKHAPRRLGTATATATATAGGTIAGLTPAAETAAAAGWQRKREVIFCCGLVASSLVTVFSWYSSCPTWLNVIKVVLAPLDVAVLVTIFWGNVDFAVLRTLLQAFEVHAIVVTATLPTVFQSGVREYGFSAGNCVDHASFVLLACLFAMSDCLRQRSLPFRRFCHFLFMAFVVFNFIDNIRLVDEHTNFTVRLGSFTVTHNLASAVVSCYAQILTLSLPACLCVIRDRHQRQLALVRTRERRPAYFGRSSSTTRSTWWSAMRSTRSTRRSSVLSSGTTTTRSSTQSAAGSSTRATTAAVATTSECESESRLLDSSSS